MGKLFVQVITDLWLSASCAGGREFESQRPAKSDAALQTIRHRFNIYASSCVALALWRGDGLDETSWV